MAEVRAELMGSVWRVQAAVGDAVEEDDVLIILESMKMEIPVMAPSDGTVVQIAVAEGDAVEEDALLAVVEPA